MLRNARLIALSLVLILSCARADLRDPSSAGKPSPQPVAKVVAPRGPGPVSLRLGIPTHQAYTMAVLEIGEKPFALIPDTDSNPTIVPVKSCETCGCIAGGNQAECYAPVADSRISCGTPGMCDPAACGNKASPSCAFTRKFTGGGREVRGIMLRDDIGFRDSNAPGRPAVLKQAAFGGALVNRSVLLGHGILGLQPNGSGFRAWGPTLPTQFFRAGNLPRVSAFCLWDGRGRLDLGYAGKSDGSGVTIPLSPDGARNRIEVGEIRFRAAFGSAGTGEALYSRAESLGWFPVDSGSSMTSLKAPVYAALKKKLQEHARQKDGECRPAAFCGEINVFNSTLGNAWSFSDDEIAALPTLLFKVKDAAGKDRYLEFSPRQYMVRWMDKPNAYLFGFKRGKENRFGLNFMRRRRTIFNHDRNTLTLRNVNPAEMCTGRSWKEVPAQPFSSMKAGAFQYGDRIYVMGGIAVSKKKDRLVYEAPPNFYYRKHSGDSYTIEILRNDGLGKGVGNRVCALLKDAIYCGGGQNVADSKVTAEVVKLNLKNPVRWEKVASMTTPRMEHNLVACGDGLYAFGGLTSYISRSPTTSMEKYMPGTNRWVKLKTVLPQARSDSAAGCLNGKVYIAGGTGDASGTPSNLIHVFNTGKSAWGNVLEFPYAISTPSVFTGGDNLFIHDGASRIWRMTRTESRIAPPYFLPEPSLPTPRYRPALLYDPGSASIHVFGGGDKNRLSLGSAGYRYIGP